MKYLADWLRPPINKSKYRDQLVRAPALEKSAWESDVAWNGRVDESWRVA
jgi:hypothetical protein